MGAANLRRGTSDEAFMRRALRLAARGLGRTSPNPVVGAVVVKDGRVLATGYHRRAGLDHAEVAALRRLGFQARGADLYVTLEPCNHHGRTPPCTEAVIRAGIRRVVVGMRDPCRLVDGRGIRRLRRAGIAVEVGLLGPQCRRVNEHFLCVQEQGRPFVTWKAAVTLDGRIATRRGDSRWVTGARARALGHALRDTHDAILVGAGTVRVDDPLLTTRRRGGRDPVRVVLDGRLAISPRARLLHSGSPAPTLVVCGRGAPAARERALVAAGAEVLRLPGRRGRVSPAALLAALLERGLLAVLIEGGGETAAAFLEAGLVDKVVVIVAPKLVGGVGAVPMLGGRGVARMAEAVQLCDITYRQIGAEMVISGHVHRDH
ncbi:MAG: bifunctional diaminohydroxyphosphoribosylaminopyrimidine deaminase/5-amino-6-(5-phosphoribosylamino)uracil reductase RibD [Deltaproteobacteria bacterium]|nr:bifunctional diaminohydroxyphosphoribosylaminopyrimidine deaminase/5-amino-6-(5-phosphoribosylamino)uracil reductase RibD [Deltaproteobacteria bacterium]